MFFDAQGEADINHWISSLEKLVSKNDPFILICRSGRRSNILATILSEQANYLKVFDATDGMKTWIGSGYKTVKPKL